MNFKVAGLAALAAMVLALARCGPGSPPGRQPDTIIIDINNAWQVAGNQNHSFSFFNQAPRGEVSSASFDGNETAGAQQFQLHGQFSGTDIQFTVQRSGGITLNGKILDKRAIRIVSPEEYLLFR